MDTIKKFAAESLDARIKAYKCYVFKNRKEEIKIRKQLKVKTCNCCKKVKGFDAYYKDSSSVDQKAYTCKICITALDREKARREIVDFNYKTRAIHGYVERKEQAQQILEIKRKIIVREKAIPAQLKARPVVYVSLPIGYGKLPNVDQLKLAKTTAKKIATQIHAMGYRAETPFTIGVSKNMNYDTTLMYCLQFLEIVRPLMFFLDGWSQSYGCTKEWFKAHHLGLSIEKENTNGLYALQHRAEMLNIHPNFALVV